MKHFLKTLVIALPIWALIMGLMYYGCFVLDSKPKTGPAPINVIQDTTDTRGLISVIFTQGRDTFALDYLTRAQYDSCIKCPKCGEIGCIYEDIDTRIDEGTDAEISAAIYNACKDRNITDSATIELLKREYYQ